MTRLIPVPTYLAEETMPRPIVMLSSVAALFDNETLSYTYATGLECVTPGRLVIAENFRYIVAPQEATDHHITTQGGVKIYVQPMESGAYNVRAFGAVGDGVTDDTLAFLTPLEAGYSLHVPATPNEYLINSDLRFTAARQWMSGEGLETQIHYTGGGTFLDFDGWAGCKVENLVMHSSSAATGIRVGPDSTGNRFAHFWRLDNIILIGDTPNWLSTALADQRLGFSRAAFEFVTCFYGHAQSCEAAQALDSGFLLTDRANGNMFSGVSARECGRGVTIEGNQTTNGNTFQFKNVEASFDGSIGIDIGEADRNSFGGRMEMAGAGSLHVRIDPPSGFAQDNNFVSLMCTGPALGFEIGSGSGTDKVRGTFIMGGLHGGGIDIRADAANTRIETTPQAISGTSYSDLGSDTVYHADIKTTGAWYEKHGTDLAHQLISSGSELTLDAGAKSMVLKAGNNPRLTIRDDGLLEIPGNIMVAGTDQGGAPGYLSFTNSSNVSAPRSTGVGTVKFVDGVDRDNVGFLQIRIGTSAYFMPLFNAN